MNFNPQNEQGILGLISALKGGMDPSAAYSIFSNIQQDQASQVAQRQERLGGLAQLLMGAAQSGMPFSGAESLDDAAPGPMGPAVNSMMQALYPTADETPPAAPMSASGQPIEPPPGYYDQLGANPTGMNAPNAGPEALSPTFMPAQPSPTESLAMQQASQDQAIMGDLTALQADAAKMKAQGWTLDQFLAAAQKNNPQLFAAAPEQVKAVLSNTFGEFAYKTMGAPSV